MKLTNSNFTYGWLSIGMHWLSAILVLGLFALGLWMTSLGYYHEWYRTAPHIHKSIGVLTIMLIAMRFVWNTVQVKPEPLGEPDEWQTRAAPWAHRLLYLLLFLMLPSGYLISTADGRSLEVFDLFSLPALITDVDNLEDIAGEIHEYLAFTLIALVSLHALAALKHHFFDKDATLKRMFKPSTEKKDES